MIAMAAKLCIIVPTTFLVRTGIDRWLTTGFTRENGWGDDHRHQ
jgi:hypothetical protein